MRKRRTLIVSAVSVIGMAALFFMFAKNNSSQVREYDLASTEVVQVTEYKEDSALKDRILLTNYQIPLSEEMYVNAFCVYGNGIYYAVDYQKVFENPEGTKIIPAFTDEYQTQIRMKNLDNGEDTLLYQYDADAWVEVTDMRCDGKELVWEDYQKENDWNGTLKCMRLDESLKIEEIAASDEKGEGLSAITPALYGGGSPYEHLNLVDGVLTTYQYQDDGTSIIDIEGSETGKCRIKVLGSVCAPVSNKKVCVWTNGYDAYSREQLLICEYEAGKIEKIETPRVFSYGLTSNYLVVNTEKGLYVYDTEKKEYAKLIVSEETPCGYTFQGASGELYAELWRRDAGNSNEFCVCVIRETE